MKLVESSSLLVSAITVPRMGHGIVASADGLADLENTILGT